MHEVAPVMAIPLEATIRAAMAKKSMLKRVMHIAPNVHRPILAGMFAFATHRGYDTGVLVKIVVRVFATVVYEKVFLLVN